MLVHIITPPSMLVAYALVRAASTLVSMPVRREEPPHA
jgi:hypothetical protein